VWLGLAGAAFIAAGFYAATLPPIYEHTSFWTSSPTYFAIRVGVMMVALPASYAAARAAAGRGIALRPLERLGRSSLFVYWIHVELVYGYASWFWRGRLPLWATAIGYTAFVTLMYGALRLRDRWRERWLEKRGQGLTLHRKELSVRSAQ
jgi:peptidoglycan/LPS O-acetylase OafA/YrhL